jgi:SAM-dependent methyltransferase
MIDVGAGESTLVVDLLCRGDSVLYAMEISSTAIDVANARLGTSANKVNWLCGDVRTFGFARHAYDLWHDRAVFHFLTDANDRLAYVRQVARAVKPGSHVIVPTFGPEGPTKYSGLDVVRYGPEAPHDEFGNAFRLVEHRTELHKTPMGSLWQFTYCCCKISEGPD